MFNLELRHFQVLFMKSSQVVNVRLYWYGLNLSATVMCLSNSFIELQLYGLGAQISQNVIE